MSPQPCSLGVLMPGWAKWRVHLPLHAARLTHAVLFPPGQKTTADQADSQTCRLAGKTRRAWFPPSFSSPSSGPHLTLSIAQHRAKSRRPLQYRHTAIECRVSCQVRRESITPPCHLPPRDDYRYSSSSNPTPVSSPQVGRPAIHSAEAAWQYDNPL